MKLALKLGAAFLVSVFLGLGSVYWFVEKSDLSGTGGIAVGPWTTNEKIGDVDAAPYTRAIVARRGLLALNKRETVYFNAEADSSGTPLVSNCRYTVTGKPIPTGWWSITLYGADHYLVDNPQGIFSQAKNTVTRNADQGYVIQVASAPEGPNGIPTGYSDGEGERFSLTLRLYNLEENAAEDLSALVLPSIEKGDCQ
ncbi:MAG: hypothetical protein ACJAVO_001291 [Parvibaculaceae bacterium]|jgi:hypothetical protein|nr:DUF1214 domain-containing protein [Parvibaculaceae bacterium]